jgi:hypothetical protein
VEHATR